MARRIANVDDARRLLRDFERGVYTRAEAISLFIQAAASCPAAELAEVLPADWLEMIRVETSPLPESPSDVVFISGILGKPGFDYDAYLAEMRQRWFDGTRNWHEHFT